MTAALPMPATLDRRLLAALAVVAAVASVYAYRSADADLWGHLRYGQFCLSEGRIADDPYAYTSAGRRWSTHEYLAQMVLAWAYGWAGPAGLIVLKCLLGGATVLCLYAGLRTSTADARIWAPLLMLTAQALGQWLQFRPQLFTYLFFAFYVLTLFRYLLGRTALLWLLPLLMPLWVNLHGGFLAGIGAVGLALLGRVLQSYNREGLHPASLGRATWPLLLTLAGCFAGSLVNPLGWRIWPYLATEMGHAPNGRYLQEWQPASFHDQPWVMALLCLLLGLLLLLTVLAQLQRKRSADLAPWQWLLSCAPLTVMALLSMRHIPILTIWGTPVLGLLAHEVSIGWAGKRLWDLTWLTVSGVILMPTLLMLFAVASDPRPRISTGTAAFRKTQPYQVAAFLKANHLHGRLYTPLWWGSYFTWELYPDILVSMDGRNVTLFHPDDVTANLEFYHDKPDLDTPLKGDPDYLVVPADTLVLERLRSDDRWAVLFEDPNATLFVRNDQAHRKLLRRARDGELSSPEPAKSEYLE